MNLTRAEKIKISAHLSKSQFKNYNTPDEKSN